MLITPIIISHRQMQKVLLNLPTQHIVNLLAGPKTPSLILSFWAATDRVWSFKVPKLSCQSVWKISEIQDSSWLFSFPQYTHLFQDDACRLVDGPTNGSISARVADKGPCQHGHHDHTHSAIAHQGEGWEPDEEQHTRQHVEKAHEDKEHCRCPEGAEEIFRLQTEKNRLFRHFPNL